MRNISAMIEWWSGLDGQSRLISAPMSYGLIILLVISEQQLVVFLVLNKCYVFMQRYLPREFCIG